MQFEMLYNSNFSKPYIRKIIRDEDNDHFMIICCYDSQLEFLMSLKSFEVDMSYKCVGDKTITEIVFATLIPKHGKSKC